MHKPASQRLRHALVAAIMVLISAQFIRADDSADDDDSLPGLIARYSVGDQSIERIDRDVQFVWDAYSPDARLPEGTFAADWRGRLNLHDDTIYTFHFFIQGKGQVNVGGRNVVEGESEQPAWISGKPIRLSPGEPPLEITFQKVGPGAVLRLFWSCELFPLEPVPASLFFRDAARTDLLRIERGGELYQALKCNRCHRRKDEPVTPPAPSLVKLAAGLNVDWLVNWLQRPDKTTPHARMPGFGFSPDEARAVAGYLWSKSKDVSLPEVDLADRDQSHKRGELLFRSIGCLACHTHSGPGIAGLTGGGDLTSVGTKRSVAWLAKWLKEPAELNADHRMPVFNLSDDERRDLAVYLAGSKAGPKPENVARVNDRQLALGEKLVRETHCGECHQTAGDPTPRSEFPAISRQNLNSNRSCVEPLKKGTVRRPVYELSAGQIAELQAFVASRSGKLSGGGPHAAGERLLRQANCLSCHDRESRRGVSTIAGALAQTTPELTGQSQLLIPPDLSGVGDKLIDQALETAIKGEQKPPRLPWLRVRMPRFHHTPEELAAIRTYLVGHDRIPDGGPVDEAVAELAATEPKRQLTLKQGGQVLAGMRGFSCVGCHKLGSYEPRGAAQASRGSDLYDMAKRMRPEFFVRWTRSPLRVVRGIEMPSFEKPAAKVLDGNLNRQLAGLWVALNDPAGAPKVDTTIIEQVVNVYPGDNARLIRGVFNVGDFLKESNLANGLAIGLPSGHNLLFDVDTLSVRWQWLGEFARLRASGKSWYWEPAGDKQAAATPEFPDLVLRRTARRDDAILLPIKRVGRYGKLLGFGNEDRVGMVCYELTWDLEGRPTTIQVLDRFIPAEPVAAGRVRSLTRDIRADGVPKGYELLLLDSFPEDLSRIIRHNGTGAESDTPVDIAIPEQIAPVRPNKPQASTRRKAARLIDVPTERFPGFDTKFTLRATVEYQVAGEIPRGTATLPAQPGLPVESVSTVPGYDGIRLPLPRSIMPTAITWTSAGQLAFCSLKGQVYLAADTNGDGIEDALEPIEEGLAAPYGLIADGQDLIVAHKPELLRLRAAPDKSRKSIRLVVASGWGYTDDYHDWTCGIVRDSRGNLYVGLGSDYAKPGRDSDKALWRGKVLRIDPQGRITPMGHAFRYPTGLAITPDDQVFVSDNQGVQNPFNEINHLVEGAHYGVPSLFEEPHDGPPTLPAIQVPHPWTRSVNGLFFLPVTSKPSASSGGVHPFAGHGIGCEYDSRFLVRFTLQRVGETYQGAVYPFSRPAAKEERGNFLGTICGAVSPAGDIYIGSFTDSGWLGGNNMGDIVRLKSNGKISLGIREIRAFAGEFEIQFTAPIDNQAARRPENYDITGYTRKWQGAYATPDSNRHKLTVKSVTVANDLRTVILHVEGQQAGHVYEINTSPVGPDPDQPLRPAVGHYTLNQIPVRER